MVTVGYGVSSHAPLMKYGELGQWIYGSRYWASPSVGDFSVYDCNSMKAVIVAARFWTKPYEFMEEPEILIWVGCIEFGEIGYPLVDGPASKPDYSANVADFSFDHTFCLRVYEFATGDSYVAAAPDLTTLSKGEDGYGHYVILRPTERFAATPLFGAVSETGIYKEHVGEPIYAVPSQE